MVLISVLGDDIMVSDDVLYSTELDVLLAVLSVSALVELNASLVCFTEETVSADASAVVKVRVTVVVSSVEMGDDEDKLEYSVDFESVTSDVWTWGVVSTVVLIDKVEEDEVNVDSGSDSGIVELTSVSVVMT